MFLYHNSNFVDLMNIILPSSEVHDGILHSQCLQPEISNIVFPWQQIP